MRDGTTQDVTDVEQAMQNLKFDGSVDIQVMCTIKTKTKKQRTIFVKARMENEIG